MSTHSLLQAEYSSRRTLMARLIDACEQLCPDSTTMLRGILLQLDWQWASGRWTASTLAGSDWWKKANYTLTAWVALAAEKQGILSLTTAERDQLDPTLAAPRDVMEAWSSFFAAVADAGAAKTDAKPLADLNRLYWMAHDACLDEIAGRFNGEMTKLPHAERRFAGAWIAAVRLLAKLRFNPGYSVLQWLQSWLPTQALNEHGWANCGVPTRVFIQVLLATEILQVIVSKQVASST